MQKGLAHNWKEDAEDAQASALLGVSLYVRPILHFFLFTPEKSPMHLACKVHREIVPGLKMDVEVRVGRVLPHIMLLFLPIIPSWHCRHLTIILKHLPTSWDVTCGDDEKL